jgi:hypothetical protein
MIYAALSMGWMVQELLDCFKGILFKKSYCGCTVRTGILNFVV